MSASRAIQNFRGFRALWWGPRGDAADALTGALHRLGLTLAYLDEIGVDAVAPERDILFVDGDGLFDPALFGRPGLILPAIPVIGVVGVEAPSRLKALADTGATAFLRKPIHPATVYSSLFLAANNHARFSRLEAQLAEHNRRRSGRRYVIRAVVGLMNQSGMTDEQAYAHLRRESMRRRVGVEDYARDVCRDLAPIDHQPQQETDDVAHQDDASGRSRAGGDDDGRASDGLGGRPDQTRRA